MKKYKITIPAFSKEVYAPNKKEALEEFMYDYDQEQGDPDFNQPIIKEIKKKKKTKVK